MKSHIAGLLVASIFTLPASADNQGSGHGSGGSGTPTSSSSSSATGGAGGSGGTATGGAATGGSATGGTSTVSVSVTVPTDAGSGSSGGTGNVAAADLGAVGEAGSSAYNTKATVDYGGTYTVKSVPSVLAPSLTATLSDTCMGSASFGLSIVGFGATGGTTVVDDACVRRLDSREFRAMGLNDVALALLCQSEANRKAVESTGRLCPGGRNEPTVQTGSVLQFTDQSSANTTETAR